MSKDFLTHVLVSLPFETILMFMLKNAVKKKLFKKIISTSLHKNIQLMQEFLKVPFLVLNFSYYTSMIFPMVLSVTLLSMVMILLSILSLTGHLIFGNNFLLNLKLLLNFNLIYKTLWTRVRSGLLISMLGKLIWFRLTVLNTMVLLM